MDERPNCLRCGHDKVIKAGWVDVRQRWQCKACHYLFLLERKPHPALPEAMKRDAVKLYREGNGFRAIARLQGVSHTSARHWVEAYARALAPQPPAQGPVRVVEVDEMAHYVKKKTTSSGSGKR